jgi:DMSO/TMAO reductase YedYZ heme-binding membrane subunit
MLDSYVHFGWVDVLVPFASSWHPLAVAWGVIAMWMLVAVEVTSLLKRSLPLAVWRRVHVLAFPLYVMASVHLLLAGTERTTLVLRATVLLTTAAIALLSVERVEELLAKRRRVAEREELAERAVPVGSAAGR